MQRVGPGLRAECFFDESLAEGFAKLLVGIGDAFAPSRSRLVLAGEFSIEEIERRVVETCGKPRGGAMYQVPGQIVFQILDGSRRDNRVESFHKLRFSDIDGAECRRFRCGEVAVPVEAGSQ